MYTCPNQDCDGQLTLKDRACPRCGFDVSVESIARHCFSSSKKFLVKVRETKVALDCPHCKKPNQLSATECWHCLRPLTVEALIEPTKQKWQHFAATATPASRLKVQMIHMVLSVILFMWLVGYIESRLTMEWVLYGVLSILYLAVFIACSLWVVPLSVRRALIHRPSPVTKVGLLFNFLSGLLILQIFISDNLKQSYIMVGSFVVVWVATWLFSKWIIPLFSEANSLVDPPNNYPFDSTGPQGRNIRHD